MKVHILSSLAFGSLALSACASTPGAQPADMSAVAHEQAASSHESQATPHQEQFNASAQTTDTTCDTRGGVGKGIPCWTSTANPTEQHLSEAKMHRKMAADHRTAAKALRDAEAWACTGISDDDRDMSPFEHREDVTSAEPAYVHISGKQPHDQLVGAVVTFRAVPMMTAQWLQRVVDCHLARNSALGNDVPEMPYCPLVPKGITATVSSTGSGFAVRIESQDSASASEVLRRAQALKGST